MLLKRISMVATVMAILLSGCDSDPAGTTMPTTPPVMPPEADQMKDEMTKKLKLPTPKKLPAATSNSASTPK